MLGNVHTRSWGSERRVGSSVVGRVWVRAVGRVREGVDGVVLEDSSASVSSSSSSRCC